MSSAADDAEFQRSLLSSIHDYLQRKGFKQTAKSLLKEVKTAGLSVETCKCNLEDLWTSSQVAKKSGKVPETSKVERAETGKATDSGKSSSQLTKQLSSAATTEHNKTKNDRSAVASISKLSTKQQSSDSSTSSSSSAESESSTSRGQKSSSSLSVSESSSSESETTSSSDGSSSSDSTDDSSSTSSSSDYSSSSESRSSDSSTTSSSFSSRQHEDSVSSKDSNSSNGTRSSATASEESSTDTSTTSRSSSSSASSSASNESDSSDTQSSSSSKSESSASSTTDSSSPRSSSGSSSSEDVKEADLASKAKEKEKTGTSKRQREDFQEKSHTNSTGTDFDHSAKFLSQKKSRTNANNEFREDGLISSTPRDNLQASEDETILHNVDSTNLKDCPVEGNDREISTLRRFQRIQPDSVKFADEKLRDNSYDAKGGEMYGLRAWEELKKVRGKDFRKAKTKKKRSMFFGGGTIDKDSHSFHFTYSDEDA